MTAKKPAKCPFRFEGRFPRHLDVLSIGKELLLVQHDPVTDEWSLVDIGKRIADARGNGSDAQPEIPPRPPARLPGLVVERRFYIDANGVARRDPGGVPIMPDDVGNEVLYDERAGGRGDLDSIVWAQGTFPTEALPALNLAGRQ